MNRRILWLSIKAAYRGAGLGNAQAATLGRPVRVCFRVTSPADELFDFATYWGLK